MAAARTRSGYAACSREPHVEIDPYPPGPPVGSDPAVAPPVRSSRSPDTIVVGAGINGLATAWQLARRGQRVCVLDQHPPGHTAGSSHGATRITRASYGDPLWVNLVAEAHRVDWPELEAEAGYPLITRRTGCFFGPVGGPIEDYAEAARGVVEPLSPAEAAERFPLFRFEAGDRVLADPTAGVVHAARTLHALRTAIVRRGGELRFGAQVTAFEAGPPHRVHLADGATLSTPRLVLCAGPWTPGLLSGSLGAQSRPLRVLGQTAAHFDHPAADTAPPWAYITPDQFFYGLPGRATIEEGPSLKAALHHTVGPDMGLSPVEPDPREVTAFLASRLVIPPGAPIRTETCRYTMTDDERFVLDVLAPGLVIGAGFSGHSFKFGPLTGRILAGLCLDGETDVRAFERDRFRLHAGGADVDGR